MCFDAKTTFFLPTNDQHSPMNKTIHTNPSSFFRKGSTHKTIIMFVLSFFTISCAPSLEDEWEWDDTPLQTDTADTIEEEGVYSRAVDATDYENWVYLDLESNDFVSVDDPMTSEEWDIGIQRYHFKLNSGIHGPSIVQALVITDESYDEYTVAAVGDYQQDLPDSNEDDIPEYVFTEWYDYDPSTHILTPKEQFYVIENRNLRYYKFQITNYYSSAGTSGFMNIEWEEIASPE